MSTMATSAANAGATAAVKGKPREANPYDHSRQAELHLAWNIGHAGMRARMELDREKEILQ